MKEIKNNYNKIISTHFLFFIKFNLFIFLFITIQK